MDYYGPLVCQCCITLMRQTGKMNVLQRSVALSRNKNTIKLQAQTKYCEECLTKCVLVCEYSLFQAFVLGIILKTAFVILTRNRMVSRTILD